MNNKTFLILPGCDDTNRGDQALIWETVALGQDAGFEGKYFMIAEKSKSQQSFSEGIGNLSYILPHPSTHFKQKNNIQYGILLKIKWALVSIIDSIKALFLLNSFVRKYCISLYSEEIQRSINIFQNSEAAFVKGGGFLHTYGKVVETYTVFFNLYHIILALSMKIPVYVMPNSYGPFDSMGSKFLIKNVLKRCRMLTARESISQMALRKVGVECEVFPDLAFYLKPDYNLNKEQQEKIKHIPFGEKPCVALTMRPYRFPASNCPEKDYKFYQKSLCRFVQYLSKKGYYPVLIEHTYSDTEHERDMICIKEVGKSLGKSCEYTIYSDLSLNSRQLKYVYSKFDYIVGTRFHSVIFSLASGVPALAITYGGNKGEGIMTDMGLSDYALSIDDLTYQLLVEKFNNLVGNQDIVKKKIEDYSLELSEKRYQLVKKIRGSAE